MKGIRILGVLALSLLSFAASAQRKVELPLFRELNYLGNVQQGSLNPTSLSYNPVGDMVRIDVGYGLDRGDYHDVDRSSKSDALGVTIEGYHRFGKVDCFGSISYRNGKERSRRWNSTMYIDSRNPFILGDSIRSDFSIEEFDLQAGVSYRPVKALLLGLRAQYLTGSSANQTDPRPLTNAMHLVINPGVSVQLGRRFSLGVSADIDILREDITHTIINTQEAYLYFRFKGMGDFATYSSSASGAYPRDYDGETYKGAFQFAARNADGTVANFLEFYYLSGAEDARDGGSAFTFLGGDYSHKGYGLSERFTVRGRAMVHNISLSASFEKGEGIWYDQQAKRDPDNNNALYFEVLNKSLINTTTDYDFSAAYRMDLLDDSKPTLSWFLNGQFVSSKTLHYEDDGYMQKYTKAVASLGAIKHINMRRCLLSVSLTGRYALPLSSSFVAMPKLESVYTAPAFEYAVGSYGAGEFGISAQFPVDFSGFKTWIGLRADAAMSFYTGNSKYSDVLRSTRMGNFSVGVNLLF